MSRTDIKSKARENLMHAMMAAFYDDLTDEMREEMHKQVNKVEKLFGYEVGSWNA
jgi:chemotaxis regulatin CheY-phosphate phosphatase CheZ